MQAALRTDMAGLQWVVDAYALCLSAFILSAGPLGDRYGRKRSWLAGVLLFVAGSAMCGLAGGLPMLLAGRAVQGVAGALLIPGALSLLTQAFPDPRERADHRHLGIQQRHRADRRPGAGRRAGGALQLAEHIPHQPAAGRAGGGAGHVEHPRKRPSRTRRVRSAGPGPERGLAGCAGLRPDRRGRAWLGLASGRPRAGAGGGRPGGLRDRGTARAAAGAAAGPVPRPRLRSDQLRILRAGLLRLQQPVLLLALPATGAGACRRWPPVRSWRRNSSPPASRPPCSANSIRASACPG